MNIRAGLLLLLALFCGSLFAQTSKGTIAGTVVDPSGAAVSGAVVTATSAGGETRSVTTGDTGDYRIESLTPGDYTLTVGAAGFATRKVNVNVRTSITSSANISLNVGEANTTVTVEGSVPTVQTETGELSKTIPTESVKDLPYGSQNPYSLATTLPGVVTVQSRDDFTNGAGFSVNGLRPRANNFLIDGFDNNDNGIAGQAFQPTNTEAVQEVTVLTNSYSAEFGRGGGSVSNLTFRRGTNGFHGAVFEQYNGSALNALASEDVGSTVDNRQPQTVSNTFGFRLGGPIMKDKLHFFGTSQWSRAFGSSSSAAVLTIPTAAGFANLQTLAGNPNVDVLLTELGDLRGVLNPATINVGNRPGCGSPCLIEVGDIKRTDTTKSLNREWTARVDFTPNQNDNFMVRYTDTMGSFSPDLFANPDSLPYRDTQQGGPARILGTMWSHVFSPTVLNEFRFSAQQIDFAFGPTAAAASHPLANFPTYSISNIGVGLGGFSQGVFPQGRGHKTFQFQDAVSIIRGRNSFKLGADVALLLIRDQIPFNTNGSVGFLNGGDCSAIGLATCTALANYIDNFSGPSATLSKNFGNSRISVPANQQAYYFQGTWKALQNLTLDYGVRYEYQPPDQNNVLPFPSIDRATVATDPFQTRHEVQADRNNWAPRFGFAYTPNFWSGVFGNNLTVIRGGYGIFYDAFFTNISNNTASASPNTLGGTTQVTTGRGVANPFAAINAVTATASPTTGVTSVVSDLRNPMTHQWNLNVQRELPLSLMMEVAYVGTRGTGLWVNEQLNPRVGGGARIIPTRGSIVVRGNRGDSNYHGLQTTVTRNVRNLTLRGSYTWSRSIDNTSEVFVTSGGASRWQNVMDPGSDRGPSAFHRTHRGAISYVFEIPFPRDKGFLTQVLGGWGTSGILSWQSGAPETIYAGGFDQNGDGEAFNDRPSIGNPNVKINYSPACLDVASTCNTGVGFDVGGGTVVDFNSSFVGTANDFKYVFNGLGQNGTLGRNSFYFPGRQDYNLSVFKRFALPGTEEHRIEFRADFLNAFNHPNLGAGGLSGDVFDPNFLNFDTTRRGGRTIVLWAKYQF